jgi:hypothetical protein
MSRKDYMLIADAIAVGLVTGKMISAICDALQKDNPTFNRTMFESYLKSKLGKE